MVFRATKTQIVFDNMIIHAILKSFWVRRLIGKPGVPYNRRLRVRGSSHPHYDDGCLSLPAAESNAFRAHSDWLWPEWRIAPLIAWLSSGETRVTIKMPRFLAFGTFGLPIFVLIKTLCVTKIIVDKRYIRLYT
jgi:hypothetical protein